MNLIREEAIRNNIYNNEGTSIKVQMITKLKYQYVDIAEFEKHCSQMEIQGFTLDKFINENAGTLDKPEYYFIGEYFTMHIYDM